MKARSYDGRPAIEVIVGLGNPGRRYEKTLHNVGFRVVDKIAESLSVKWKHGGLVYEWGVYKGFEKEVLLVKPLTFMNLSGVAVKQLVDRCGVSVTRMMVVHDDIDLPVGRIRIVRGGGAGGHRGVLSIIERLGCSEFPRTKLGVGRPKQGESVEEYVLGEPYPEDQPIFSAMIVRGAEAILVAMSEGLEAAMNRFNRCLPLTENR